MSKYNIPPYWTGKQERQNMETTTIQEAYNDLTQQAFAVWVRLAVSTDKELFDRRTIAKTLGYSLSQANLVVTELRRKGYIRFEHYGNPGRRSKLVFRKRTIISGEANFINLSSKISSSELSNESILQTNEKQHVKKINRNPIKSSIVKKPGIIPGKKLFFEQLTGLEALDDFFETDNTPKNKRLKKKKSVLSTGNHISNKSSKTRAESKEKTVKKPRKKSVISGEDSNSVASEINNHNLNDEKSALITKNISYSLNKNNKLDIDKLKFKVKQEKDKRKTREKNKLRSNLTSSSSSFDWNRISQDDYKFDFDLSDDKREKVIEILERKKKDKRRKLLVAKIGSEFADIYTRYRRLVQESNGNRRNFKIYKDELKHAQKTGEWCILKGIAPIDLLKYWHENISNFANANLQVPPLSFLSSPVNIETAICSSEELEMDKSSEIETHSYSDISKLHPKLRSGLTSAGFDVQELSDRYLMTVQSGAKTVAAGIDVYIPTSFRGMSHWAAKNLYGWEEE